MCNMNADIAFSLIVQEDHAEILSCRPCNLFQMIKKFAALILIGMASPYQILDWYGGRHTCHTASGAPAIRRPRKPHPRIKHEADRMIHCRDKAI